MARESLLAGDQDLRGLRERARPGGADRRSPPHVGQRAQAVLRAVAGAARHCCPLQGKHEATHLQDWLDYVCKVA